MTQEENLFLVIATVHYNPINLSTFLVDNLRLTISSFLFRYVLQDLMFRRFVGLQKKV